MPHLPRRATLYRLGLPDEASARGAARALAERGHTAVCLAPLRPDLPFITAWQVTSLDQGPYPDGDVHWWTAAEERCVAVVADTYGGGHTCLQEDAATARRLLLDGAEFVADRSPADVRELRLAALRWEPDRVPAPAVVHALDAPGLPCTPGEPVVLHGLDEVPWSSLVHAYRTAEDVPEMFRALAANDGGWDEALSRYFSAVVHQGTCFACTPGTVEFLVQLALAPGLAPGRRRNLLLDLAHMATLYYGGLHEAETRAEIVRRVPRLLALWPDVPAPLRAWLLVLAALAPDTAAGRLDGFRAFRVGVEGPSPALDLALAMCARDDGAVLDITADAAAWDDDVPRMLEVARPLRVRQLNVLMHLALAEFGPRTVRGDTG
ncbi:hypothetical protein [Actinomadura sp. 21ATH]|uniref:hypothetical protein n=1 Tax=Actinomadura sp. 21ATH TaxID=1735444 RepID=UPI0035BF32A9